MIESDHLPAIHASQKPECLVGEVVIRCISVIDESIDTGGWPLRATSALGYSAMDQFMRRIIGFDVHGGR